MSSLNPTTNPVRRAVAVLTTIAMTALLSVVGMAPAHAAGSMELHKELDAIQSDGFTAPNTFEAGALVRYHLTFQCASLTDPCVTGHLEDVLDPNLEFVEVIPASSSTSTITAGNVGNTVTVDISNWQAGTLSEVVVIARVKPDAAGLTIPNQATITSPNAQPASSEVVEIIVPDAEPDWSIVKYDLANETPAPDSVVPYRILLSCNTTLGNVNIASGTIVDTFPDGAIVVSAHGGVVDYATNTITWQVSEVSCDAPFDKYINLIFPSTPRAPGEPVFVAGQTVVNNVLADVVYDNGDEGELVGEAPITLADPRPSVEAWKEGPPNAAPGFRLSWNAYAWNNGNTALTDPYIVDVLPAGIEDVEVYAPSPGRGYPANPTVYEQMIGGVWQPLGEYSGGAVPFSFAVDPAATAVRGTAQGLVISDGRFGDLFIKATVSADAPASITNCADAVSGELTSQACVTTVIGSERATLSVRKEHVLVDPNAVTVKPGQSFKWGFQIASDSLAGTVNQLTITDVMPAGFTYQSVACAGFVFLMTTVRNSCGPSTVAGAAVLGEPTITPNIDGAGATGLTWNVDFSDGEFSGETSIPELHWFAVILNVVADDGVAIGSYRNDVVVSAPNQTTICTGDYREDTLDIDGDGDRAETVCHAADSVEVAAAAIIAAAKYDQGVPELGFVNEVTGQPSADCPNVDDYTRYPCVAQTTPGGPLSYRFALNNIGNVDATNYVMYDILPTTGDTGVSQLLSNQNRGTEWVPQLTGPVRVLDAPAAAAPVVEYNLTSNPCRPELKMGFADGSWQASCDDTWFTAADIADWSTVKSFRVTAFAPVAGPTQPAWAPLESMLFQADLLAPIDAPQSIEDPVDLSIAWNSFAHREYRLNGDGTSVRLLPSEPQKVGVIVPFVLPDVYAVGDYVWIDLDRDGVQDSGETPVAGVTVQLLDAAGNPAVDSNGLPVASTTTDANGHYVFDNLAAGSYQVTFSGLPAGYQTTTQNNLGNQTGADDSNVASGLQTTATTPVFEIGTGLPGMTDVVASDGTTLAVAINRTIDAGLVRVLSDEPEPVYAVGDYVWYDSDKDGVQDAAEAPVPNVTVELLDAGGAVVASTTTDTDGHYVFDDLPAGTYSVRFSNLPSGFQTTAQNNGGNQTGGKDSNTPAGQVGTSTTPQFTVGEFDAGMSPVVAGDGVTNAELINRTIDAGLTLIPVVEPSPVYAVGDYVWIDTDRDGIQDATEAPVAGITVTLLDASGSVVATTTTDENGHYVFDGISAGQYQVQFSGIPSKFETTAQLNGGDQTSGNDSNVPAGESLIATSPLFWVGEGVAGTEPVVATDGTTLAVAINRTIDMGLVLTAVVLTETPERPATNSTPGLAFTGIAIGGTVAAAGGLLLVGLLLMLLRSRRTGRRQEQ